jgi:hypothetical protein
MSTGTPEQERNPVVDRPRREPLNPAYAILFGAILTATAGIGAAVLNIRSSERLSRERERTEQAAAREAALSNEVDELKAELEAANAKLAALTGSTIGPASPVTSSIVATTQPTTPQPIPSIVVVVPTAAFPSPPPSPAATTPVTSAATTTVPPTTAAATTVGPSTSTSIASTSTTATPSLTTATPSLTTATPSSTSSTSSPAATTTTLAR